MSLPTVFGSGSVPGTLGEGFPYGHSGKFVYHVWSARLVRCVKEIQSNRGGTFREAEGAPEPNRSVRASSVIPLDSLCQSLEVLHVLC